MALFTVPGLPSSFSLDSKFLGAKNWHFKQLVNDEALDLRAHEIWLQFKTLC